MDRSTTFTCNFSVSGLSRPTCQDVNRSIRLLACTGTTSAVCQVPVGEEEEEEEMVVVMVVVDYFS